MFTVMAALIPGVIVATYLFGWGVIINILVANIVALFVEAIVLKLRDKPLWPFLSDGSAIITATLLALSIPPYAPWWLITVGVLFAIVVAKHLYGGLGYNLFNPAMVGYAVLLISFPREMSTWLLPITLRQEVIDFGHSTQMTLGAGLSTVDGISGATPLDYLKTQIGLGHSVGDIMADHPLFGVMGANGIEWASLAFMIGGLWLIYKKIITWHIPVACIGGLVFMALVFHVVDPDRFATPMFHLFSGAAMLCAFFIATDPVSASTTPSGRIVYGVGIGVLIYIIRTWGGYPDAVAFAVLLMNICAPTIDYYARTKVFGRG
jgi:electron transport complex protein RnfD